VQNEPGLVRGLSFTGATALVMGASVFSKPAVMIQQVGSPWMVLVSRPVRAGRSPCCPRRFVFSSRLFIKEGAIL